MRRPNQVGRHQFAVLMCLMAFYPRPVDARWLACVADLGGDQTQGNRVLRALETRGYIARDRISRSVDRLAVLKWRVTGDGMMAFLEGLPSYVDRVSTEEAS